MLLGAARAPPPGGGGGGGGGGGSSSASCATDGSSASYTETITTKSGVSVRKIVSTGCPNHESYCTGKPGGKPTCDEEGKKGQGTEATEQSLSVEVPANPKLKSSYTAGELDCSMGTVAYALNGVGFYSGAVAFVSGGPCPQLDVADATAEWISFDCCSGHSTGSGGYHYHFPPSCLLAQADADAPVGTTIANGHSPQIGWAQDGFPICPRPVSTPTARTPSTRLVTHLPIPRRRPARPRRRRDSELRRLRRRRDLLPGRMRRLRRGVGRRR